MPVGGHIGTSSGDTAVGKERNTHKKRNRARPLWSEIFPTLSFANILTASPSHILGDRRPCLLVVMVLGAIPSQIPKRARRLSLYSTVRMG